MQQDRRQERDRDHRGADTGESLPERVRKAPGADRGQDDEEEAGRQHEQVEAGIRERPLSGALSGLLDCVGKWHYHWHREQTSCCYDFGGGLACLIHQS